MPFYLLGFQTMPTWCLKTTLIFSSQFCGSAVCTGLSWLILLLVFSRFTHVAAASLGYVWAGKTGLVLIPHLAGDVSFVWPGCWLCWREWIGQHIEVTELQEQKEKASLRAIIFQASHREMFLSFTGQSKFCGQAPTQSKRANQDSEEGTKWVHCRTFQ